MVCVSAEDGGEEVDDVAEGGSSSRFVLPASLDELCESGYAEFQEGFDRGSATFLRGEAGPDLGGVALTNVSGIDKKLIK